MKYESLYIWGPNKFSNEYMAGQIEMLAGRRPECVTAGSGNERGPYNADSLILCDCESRDASSYIAKISGNMTAGDQAAAVDIVLLNVDASANLAEELISSPIIGVFYATDDFQEITHGIQEILDGRPYIPHKLLLNALAVVRERAGSAVIVEEKSLTRREEEILELIISGHTNNSIGKHLGISSNTVKTHVGNLYKKTGVANRVEAILWASRTGRRI